MENHVTSVQAPAKAASPSEKKEKPSLRERLHDVGRKLANNVRLIDLYARGKDGYKIFEMIGPFLGPLFPSSTRGTNPRNDRELRRLGDLVGQHSKQKIEAGETYYNLIRGKLGLSAEDKIPSRLPEEILKDPEISDADEKRKFHAHEREKFDKQYFETKNSLRPEYDYNNLKNNLIGDTLNFILQWGISKYSTMSERDMVLRTYENLARDELGIENRELTFKDLKKVKNPIVREAVDYYSKKSWYRSMPDFTGLIRWIPMIVFSAFPKLKADGSKISNAMWKIAKKVDGIKLLLGVKTAYFGWYFTNRQTGSFYQAERLWNKTEGISNPSNRLVNQNTLTGDFVNQLEIARLYEEFRKENPKMGLEQFTPEDPLTNRVFEQTSRYLNHTYMPKLFRISQPGKQNDLPLKRITHSMLVELVGSGGLRVEDAMGSALRLEVMAYHGRNGSKEGIRKYREVSEVLKKIKHPNRHSYATQDEAVEAVRAYLAQIDSIGREYLGDYWPPKYVNEEMKEGFIKTIFQGTELSKEKFDYMASALFMREQIKERTYQPKETDPTSAFLDTPEENKAEAEREAQHRFADRVYRKRPEDMLKSSSVESVPETGPTIH